MDQIAVTPLGISAGSPTAERHVSSLAATLDGRTLLFDCGEGAQYQLMRAPFRWGRIEAIFLTHLHGDHVYGLPGLLGTLTLHAHEAPLFVYGPPGIRAYLDGVIATTGLHHGFPLEIVEIEEGEARKADGYTVEARRLDHSVECLGFVLIEGERPGRLDVERARALGVPEGPLFANLKRGDDVRLDDGRIVASREVVGPTRPGRRIAYVLDTRPCAAGVELARNASLLVHEATYARDHADEAHKRFHATAEQAARVAAEAGASRLLLTHFSPRYLDPSILVQEARAIFPATDAAVELRSIAV
jgi:ribonuclease Z